MSRLGQIKPLLRQLGDNAYRASPALISGEPRELRYIALGAAHSLLRRVSPLLALSGHSEASPRLSAFRGKADIDRVALACRFYEYAP